MPYREPGEGSKEPDFTGSQYRDKLKQKALEALVKIKETGRPHKNSRLSYDPANGGIYTPVYDQVAWLGSQEVELKTQDAATLKQLIIFAKSLPSIDVREKEAYEVLKTLGLED